MDDLPLNGDPARWKSNIPTNEEVVNTLIEDLSKTCLDSNGTSSSFSMQSSRTANKDILDSDLAHDIYLDGNLEASVKDMESDTKENVDKSVSEQNTVDYTDDSSTKTSADDYIDEDKLKELQLGYTDEDKKRAREEAAVHKVQGNKLYATCEYRESALSYTQGLRLCPLVFTNDRAVLYSNRAASKMKLELTESAIEDCSKAVELDESYLKAYFRRAQLYEAADKLDEALADYQKILELDPLHRNAINATQTLPGKIQERNEKLKTEMLGKLKDLGNLILRPFGLSTDNFQMNQDPNTGGYSINFNQNGK